MRLRSITRRGLLALVATPLAIPSGPLRAEPSLPLRVLCTGAMLAVAQDIAAAFTQETGRAVVLGMASVGGIGRRLRDGEKVELVLNTARQLAAMAGAGLVDGTSMMELGHIRLGLGLRPGTPPPALDSTEALRAALLAAPGIAFANPTVGAPSGVHLLRMLDTLGIGATMAPRTLLLPTGLEAAQAVAAGHATLALAQISEILSVPGLVLAGPLPEAVNMATPYAGAIASRAEDRHGAQALLRRLTSPAGQARFRAAGFSFPG